MDRGRSRRCRVRCRRIVTTYTYDPLHEAGSDLFSEYVYDKNGNRTFVTDNLGLVTRFEYDHLQRLIKMTENHRTSGGDATANTLTQYGYNSLRQSALIDPNGNATAYTYDAGLRLTRIRYPDHDPNFTDQVEYAYDKAGNLKTRSDQAGRVTTYTYDDLHHLTGRSYSTGGSESFAFDRSGRLTAADNAAVTLDFEYDDLGRVRNAWQAYVSDPATYQTQYGYVVDPADPNNPRRVVTYLGGRVVTERFDKRTRLASVSGGSGVGATFGYDLADRRTAANPANGVTGTFVFDLNGRLTSIQHARDATDLFKVEYGYDAVGNRTFTRQLTSGLTNRSELYSYDQRHRLIGFERGTIGGGSSPTLSSALADADILGAQAWRGSGWEGLDRRGNWARNDRTVGTTPVTTPETRVADAVNQYTSIDLDGGGPGAPLTPVRVTEKHMSLESTARTFVELCNQGKNFDVMRTMYAPDIVSVEGDGQATKGQQPVIRKSEVWQANNQIHGEQVRGPYFGGPDQFAVHFTFDVTRKATGQRATIEEVGVYTVNQDNLITREQFYYEGEH